MKPVQMSFNFFHVSPMNFYLIDRICDTYYFFLNHDFQTLIMIKLEIMSLFTMLGFYSILYTILPIVTKTNETSFKLVGNGTSLKIFNEEGEFLL